MKQTYDDLSIQEYIEIEESTGVKHDVLIDQDQPVVDTLFRRDASYCRMPTTTGLDKSVKLYSLGIEVPMAEIYKNIQDLQTPQFAIDFGD